jgi:hypothetical protein
MDPSKIPWLAVFLATLSTFLLGGLWYSPVLFGRVWQRAVGITDEELARGRGRVFAGAFICALIAATNLAFFLGPERTLSFGLFAGLAAGLGWVATGLTTTFLFENRPARLIAIDAGYHAVAYTIMGAIIGAWR